jgi:hypothetical protein
MCPFYCTTLWNDGNCGNLDRLLNCISEQRGLLLGQPYLLRRPFKNIGRRKKLVGSKRLLTVDIFNVEIILYYRFLPRYITNY